jgi:Lrp/AsnC family transcriptional regulator for asnA, asnC and gidA
MAYQMDSVDHRILSLLSEDGRLTCAEIARVIGHISERSIRYRLDRLLESNVLRVRGLIDPRAFGYSVTAELRIEAEPGQILDVAHAIASYHCVTYVACLAGGSDIRVQVIARDNADLFTFVSETLGKIPGVTRVSTSIVPHVVKEIDQWKVSDLPQ